MNILTSGAWELEHSSKLDIIQEPQHLHLIHKFLGDSETQIINNQDGTYTIYGNEEALLVVPQRTVTRLLLFWYCVIKGLSISLET